MMKNHVDLYNSLLEGIEDGIVNALTRKPISFTGDDPLEIRPPEDSSSYSKHDRMFYWLSDFVEGVLQHFKTDRDYSKLSDEDARNLCQIFMGGNSDEIQELINEYRILDILEPRKKKEIEEACRKFPDLSWTVLLKQRRRKDNPLWFEITWFDGNGIERPIWEYHKGDDARFIRFNNHKLMEIDLSTNTDNSIIIAKDWQSEKPVKKMAWQMEENKLDDDYFVDYDELYKLYKVKNVKDKVDADIRGFYNSWKALDVAVNGERQLYNNYNAIGTVYDYLPAIGYCFRKFKDEPIVLGNNIFGCFLPAMGQLRIMSDYSFVIDKALEMIGSKQLNINQDYWWASLECSNNGAWGLYRGMTNATRKTYTNSVLPLFALNPAEPERRGPNFENSKN